MKGFPEIFSDGLSSRWRVVEGFNLQTGNKIFSVPNTLYQYHLWEFTERILEDPVRIAEPVGHAFWSVIEIARRRFQIEVREF